MSKYYHKCCVCKKTVKREKPNYEGRIICNTCKAIENTIKCENCGKVFKKRIALRKFCSRKCSGEFLGKYVLKGKIVSSLTREKLSKLAHDKNNGYIKTKYYKIYSPYQKMVVSVQGTYELAYAKYLNDNNINWVRSNKIFINYRKITDDFNRNYYPDFYLPDINEYVEIKGYFYPKDIEKMKLVYEQNDDKIIKMLFKEDLVKLKIL